MNEAWGDAGFLLRFGDPRLDLVVWRAVPADVGDEALTPHDASFMQHLVHLPPTSSYERMARKLLISAGGLPHDHYASGNGAFTRYFQANLSGA